MTAGRATRRWVIGVLIVAFVAGCGGPTGTPATGIPTLEPGSTPTATLADPSAPAEVGPFDSGTRTFDVVADLGLGLAQAEVAARAAFRADADMTAFLGPDAQGVADALDAQTDRLLRALLTEAGVAARAAPDLAGHLASTSESRLPVPSRPTIGPPPAGSSLLGPWVSAVLMVESAVQATAPFERATETTDEITFGSSTGSVRTKSSVKITPSGSKVVIEIDVQTSGEVIDASGALLFKIEGVGKARIEAESCPDSTGLAPATVAFSATETYLAGSAAGSFGQTFESASEADIRVYSNDAAEVDRTEVDSRGEQAVQGGTRTAGGASDVDGYSVGIAEAYTITGSSGGLTSRGAQVTDAVDATQENGQGAFDLLFYLTSNAAWATATAVETAWRSGKCLDLIVDPEGGDVGPDSVTDVVATVKHHFEGNELDKPVTATLAGVAAIDPAGEEQPAPATVRYTAGPDDGDVGEISFESVSNRGIAKKTVKFTVRPAAWDVTFKGTDTEVFAIVKNSLKARIFDLRITAEGDALSGTGKLSLKGTVTSASCSGPLDQVASLRVQRGTIVGIGPDAVIRIVLTATSPAGDVIKVRCVPGGGAEIPAEGHAEQFGEALMEFDLPAAGGTVTVSKTAAIGGIFQVTIKGDFTVTPVP